MKRYERHGMALSEQPRPPFLWAAQPRAKFARFDKIV